MSGRRSALAIGFLTLAACFSFELKDFGVDGGQPPRDAGQPDASADASDPGPDADSDGEAPGDGDAADHEAGAAGAIGIAPDGTPPNPVTGPPVTGPCAEYATAPEEICLGPSGTGCLALTPDMQKALVLWLDPTTLPEPGVTVDYWCDRSGRAHHAVRVLDTFLAPLQVDEDDRNLAEPRLRRSLVLDGNWMLVGSLGDALSFTGEDTSIIVAGSVPRAVDLMRSPESENDTTFFRAYGYGLYDIELSLYHYEDDTTAIAYPTLKLVLFQQTVPEYLGAELSVYDGRFRLYGVHRSGASAQLRVNRERVATNTQLPTAPTPSAIAPLGTGSIGSGGINQSEASQSRGRIAAVVAFNGPLSDLEIGAIETFLCDQLAVCAPIPPIDPPVDPVGDAGSPN